MAWLKVWGKLRKEKHKTSWNMKNLYRTNAEGKFKENCVYLRSCFEEIFRHENHPITAHHIVHTDIQLQPVRRLSYLVRTSGPEGQGRQAGGIMRDDEQQYLCAGGHCGGAAAE